MNEAKAQAAVMEMVADKRPVPILVERWPAFCLASAVQIACRHPKFNGETRRIAEAVARQILLGVVTDPDLAELARAGWDRNCDIPVDGPADLAKFEERAQLPRPSERDVQEIEKLLIDPKETHLTAHLFRLIKKMDREHRERIRQVYPHHVEAIEHWEST